MRKWFKNTFCPLAGIFGGIFAAVAFAATGHLLCLLACLVLISLAVWKLEMDFRAAEAELVRKFLAEVFG